MATKSKGVGRGRGSGGKRPGAGRKPKHAVSVKATEQQVFDAAETIQAVRSAPRNDRSASDLLAKAFATLEDVMDNSPFPAPRVTAARAIIDLAKDEEAERSGKASGTGGKKDQRAAAVDRVASSGRFAAPSAPKLVVSNP